MCRQEIRKFLYNSFFYEGMTTCGTGRILPETVAMMPLSKAFTLTHTNWSSRLERTVFVEVGQSLSRAANKIYQIVFIWAAIFPIFLAFSHSTKEKDSPILRLLISFHSSLQPCSLPRKTVVWVPGQRIAFSEICYIFYSGQAPGP